MNLICPLVYIIQTCHRLSYPKRSCPIMGLSKSPMQIPEVLVELFFNFSMNIDQSDLVNCTSNTSLMFNFLSNVCPSSITFQSLMLMVTNAKDNQLSLMIHLSQPIKDPVPSYGFRLYNFCLKKGWIVIFLSFSTFTELRLIPPSLMSPSLSARL